MQASASSPFWLQQNCLKIRFSTLQKIPFPEVFVPNWIEANIFFLPFRPVKGFLDSALTDGSCLGSVRACQHLRYYGQHNRDYTPVFQLNNFTVCCFCKEVSQKPALSDLSKALGFHVMLLRPCQVEVHKDHKALS